MIVDGLLSLSPSTCSGGSCCELLGHGDVMRPWRWDDEGSHVRAEVGWMVLEPARLAVLDQGLVTRIVPWPQLGVELFNRGTRRAHHLAVVARDRLPTSASTTGCCSCSGTSPSAGAASTRTAS